METEALNELAARTRGDTRGATATVSLEITMGKVARELAWHRKRLVERNAAIHDIPIPAVQFPLNAGNTTIPPNSVLLGPEDGQVWDVRRLAVTGLTGVQVVSAYLEINNPAAGNPQNFLWTFSAAGTTPGPSWNPAGGLLMHSPAQIILVGTSLTVAPILSGMAIQIMEPYLADYLI